MNKTIPPPNKLLVQTLLVQTAQIFLISIVLQKNVQNLKFNYQSIHLLPHYRNINMFIPVSKYDQWFHCAKFSEHWISNYLLKLEIIPNPIQKYQTFDIPHFFYNIKQIIISTFLCSSRTRWHFISCTPSSTIANGNFPDALKIVNFSFFLLRLPYHSFYFGYYRYVGAFVCRNEMLKTG